MIYYTTTPRKPFAEDVHVLMHPYVMTQFLPRWRVISSGTAFQDKERRHFLFVVYVNVSCIGTRSTEVRVYFTAFLDGNVKIIFLHNSVIVKLSNVRPVRCFTRYFFTWCRLMYSMYHNIHHNKHSIVILYSVILLVELLLTINW